MKGFAKSILVAIVGMAAVVILMNLAFFLPWYITVVETTFEVSQAVANDNYLTYGNYEDIYETLRTKPVFSKRASSDELYITATHANGRSAIEKGAERGAEYYYDLSESYKPYVQMGGIITVKVHATYPFQMTFMGRQIEAADIPVTVTMKTVALKHYKDLNYYVE